MKSAACLLIAALTACFPAICAAEAWLSGETVLSTDPEPASGRDCQMTFYAEDWSNTPIGVWYYFQIEGLLLNRSNRSDEVAAIRISDEGEALPGDTLLTTGDARFGWEGGLRAVWGWTLDDCRAAEVGYLGIFEWSGSEEAIGDNDLAIPGDLGLASLDFFGSDAIRLDYNAELHSAEINYVLARDDEVSWLVGFRFVSLDEEFDIQGTDVDTGTSHYNTRTSNDLYGGQIGARWQRTGCCWGWDATVKAGIFGNDAEQSQFVTDFPPGFFLRAPVTANGGSAAFVGDVNISASYRLNEVWTARGGYNLLWIEGIALAPSQLDFTDTATSGSDLRLGDGLFAHGFSAGAEARW